LPGRENNGVYIKITIKKFSLQAFLGVYKILGVILKGAGAIVITALTPFRWIGERILRVFILLGYRMYNLLRNRLGHVIMPAKNTFMYLFTNRYTIHAVIVGIAVFTGASSLSAHEVRTERFGEGSLLYSIVGNQELELYEETLDLDSLKQVKEYNGKDALAVLPQVDYSEVARGELVQTVAEGSALAVPTISEGGDSVAPRDKVEDYVVEEGDTLNIIASKFGISLSTLLWANNLSSSSYIHVGDKLIIMPVSGVLHKVSKGETVAGIAKKYQAEASEVIEFNKLADGSDIRIGEKLVVPGGVKPAPKPVTTTRYTAPVSSIFSSNPPPGRSPGSGTRLLWPTSGYRITQYYHWRHHGLDIAGTYSDRIYASEGGVVTRAGWWGGYGLMVEVNHGNGMVTRYAHASKLFVRVGERVSRGQTMAMIGSTGWSTGPHIHFEVIIGGAKYNPLSYIR